MARAERQPAPAGRLLLAAAIASGLAGCLDLAVVSDVVFPATVPGLPADGPWTSLPVGRWLTEGAVRPVAISACFDEACRPRGAVGFFEASGPEVDTLARSLDSPGDLARRLSLPSRPRRGARARRPVPTKAAAEPSRVGAFGGYAVALSRPDGSRPVAGLVLGRRRGDRLTVVVVVAPDAEAAGRLATGVVAALEQR